MLTAVDPNRYDIKYLSNNLRESDALECAALRHRKQSAESQLLQCVDTSFGCLVVRDDDVPICVFGVGRDDNDGTGIPWMLGTDDLLKHSRKVAKWGYQFVEAMQQEYVMLKNIVHVGNEVSQRWLAWMGFTIVSDREVIVGGEPFYMFYRVARER